MDLRCFVALELPAELKTKVHSMTRGLRECGADVRWVSAENLHLTLKFLGNVPEADISDIRKLLEKAAAGHRSFSVDLKGIGVFPDRRRPRVVWIGLTDSRELIGLQGDIEENLKSMGFQPEKRRFSPHLTIGRSRSAKGRDEMLKELDALGDAVFGEYRADFVTLMKSQLGRSGATYTRLAEIPVPG